MAVPARVLRAGSVGANLERGDSIMATELLAVVDPITMALFQFLVTLFVTAVAGG